MIVKLFIQKNHVILKLDEGIKTSYWHERQVMKSTPTTSRVRVSLTADKLNDPDWSGQAVDESEPVLCPLFKLDAQSHCV